MWCNNINRSRSVLFAAVLCLLGLSLASFAGSEGAFWGGARAGIASIHRLPNAEGRIFTDTAAVSTAFDTKGACDQRADRGISQAFIHADLGVEQAQKGLYYIASGGVTLVIRCFGMQDGHHYLFLTGSGGNRNSVNAAMSLLYKAVAVAR